MNYSNLDKNYYTKEMKNLEERWTKAIELREIMLRNKCNQAKK